MTNETTSLGLTPGSKTPEPPPQKSRERLAIEGIVATLVAGGIIYKVVEWVQHHTR